MDDWESNDYNGIDFGGNALPSIEIPAGAKVENVVAGQDNPTSNDHIIAQLEALGVQPTPENIAAVQGVWDSNQADAPVDQTGLLASLLQGSVSGNSKVDAPTNPNAPDTGNKGDSKYSLDDIKKALGEKGVAALVQGGFGMLSGYSQGKSLEKKWEKEKEMRDQEWARKDAHSYAGKVKQMQWGNKPGLLGS